MRLAFTDGGAGGCLTEGLHDSLPVPPQHISKHICFLLLYGVTSLSPHLYIYDVGKNV